MLYRRAMAWFLLEHCLDGWHYLVDAFNSYYAGQIPPVDLGHEADLLRVEHAFVRALRDTHPLERVYCALRGRSGRDPQSLLGPDWKLDVLERLKGHLWLAFGQPSADLGGLDDRRFARAFEAAWSRALCFPDHGYGFAVIPAFTLTDMTRYAALATPYRRNRIVWEMLDWVVFQLRPSLALTVRQLDPASYQQWVNLLIALTEPLAQSLARRVCRASKGNQDDILMLSQAISQDIMKLATEQYHHLYHRMTAVKRGEIPGFLPTGFLLATRLQKLHNPELRHNPWIHWVRPSHFITRTLQRKYTLRRKNPEEDDGAGETATEECDENDHAGDSAPRQPLRSARHWHRWYRPLSPEEEHAIREEVAQAAQAQVAERRDAIELEGKLSLTVRGLARRVNCCEKTSRNHERRGHLVFMWQVPPGAKKPIRLFPDDERAIAAVRWLCGREFKDKTIAQVLGISDRHLRNRKRALKDAGLSRPEQKQHLIRLIKAQRGSS